ncbi:MAG: hypothetical protein J5793_03220 [Clostridia bacterium]|nr:hypothetical protein [Clostridia bacterium]
MKNFLRSTAAVLICVILALALSSCSAKVPVTAQTFTVKAEELGLQVRDNTEQYEGLEWFDDVDSALIAEKISDGTVMWVADYITFKNDGFIKENFDYYVERIRDNVESMRLSTKVESQNYELFHTYADGFYFYLCRVDNTFLYISVYEEFDEEAKALVDAIGY